MGVPKDTKMRLLLSFGMLHFPCVLYLIFTLTLVDATIEVFRYGEKVDTFQDRETPFDDDFVTMEGYVVLADPPEACSTIAEPPFMTNFTMGKFVLINGTEICGITTKVRNAEKVGFDVAIIFDPSPMLFEYSRIVPYPGFGINIHVVFIFYEDADDIIRHYLYNNSIPIVSNYMLKIKPNAPDITYYMYLFGAVIGVCFFVMLLFMMCLLIKCIQEKRRSRRNRLSSRQIKQIPTAKFSKGDQYDVCAICLEDYNEGDKLRILPCSHAYHAKCIDPWLMNNRRNCPLCKRKITFGDSGDESDSEDSELTSPAENTPLLTSPSNRTQSWGTFAVNPVNTVNDDGSGPSSLPDTFQHSSNPHLHPFSLYNCDEVAENQNMTEDETEHLLPPPHCSVNSKDSMAACNSEVETEVHVNFTSESTDDNASNNGLLV